MNGGCMHDSVLVTLFTYSYYRYNFQTVVFKLAKLELVQKTVYSLISMQHSTSYQTVKDLKLTTGMRVMRRLSDLHTVEHEAQIELSYRTLESNQHNEGFMLHITAKIMVKIMDHGLQSFLPQCMHTACVYASFTSAIIKSQYTIMHVCISYMM